MNREVTFFVQGYAFTRQLPLVFLMAYTFLILNCSAQAPFSNGFEIDYYYRAGKLLQMPDNSIIIFGGASAPIYGMVAKANAEGTVQWAKRFPGVFSNGVLVTSAAATGSNNFIVTVNDDLGNGVYIVKCDVSGNFQWIRKFDFAADVCKVASDGNYLLAGRNNFTGFFLYKLDPSGGLISAKNYSTGWVIYDDADKYIYDVVEHPVGDYFLLMNLGSGVFISRVDSSGAPVWIKKYLDDNWTNGPNSQWGGGKFLLMPDGSLIAAGKKGNNGLLVFRIDKDGNILWSKKYFSSFYAGTRNMFFKPNGDIVIYANANISPQKHVILEIDQTGSLLNAYALKYADYDITPLWIAPNNSGNMLLLQEINDTNSVFGFGKTTIHQTIGNFAGECLTDSVLSFSDSTNVLTSPQSFSIFETNASAPQTTTCLATNHSIVNYNICLDIGVDENTQGEAYNYVFPNPFTTQATITFGREINNATLRLYNLYGQIVLEKDNINGESVQLSHGNLQSGVYVYEVIEKEKSIYAGKAVVY